MIIAYFCFLKFQHKRNFLPIEMIQCISLSVQNETEQNIIIRPLYILKNLFIGMVATCFCSSSSKDKSF